MKSQFIDYFARSSIGMTRRERRYQQLPRAPSTKPGCARYVADAHWPDQVPVAITSSDEVGAHRGPDLSDVADSESSA
jgi:hypothetical protein